MIGVYYLCLIKNFIEVLRIGENIELIVFGWVLWVIGVLLCNDEIFFDCNELGDVS